MKKLILFTIYLIIPALCCFFCISENIIFYDFTNLKSILDILSVCSGIFSYFLLINNFIIASKIRYINLLPYDKAVTLHIMSSLILFLFIIFHAIEKIFISKKEITLVSWALIILFIAALISINLITKAKLTYDAFKKIHKYLFLFIILLSIFHLKESNILYLNNSFNNFIYNFFYFAFIIIYLLIIFYDIKTPFLKLLNIKYIENSKITILEFDKQNIKYKAGQFAFLSYKNEIHPFSFLSIPSDDKVVFAIKEIGDFTQKLKNIKEKSIKINYSFGSFYPLKNDKDLCFIGTGIGIVPILSILKEEYFNKSKKKITVIISVLHKDDLFDHYDILNKMYQEGFINLKLILNESEKFNKEMFNELINSNTKFFICSSPKLREIIINILNKINIKKENIIFEKFN